MSSTLDALQQALGYEFADRGLLELALSHRSVGGNNNERLEFLGDALLGNVIAEALYHRFPACSEGDLSRMRAALVSGESLAAMARELQLGDVLRLGQAERKSGVRNRRSVLADAFEAVLGAIALDGGNSVACDRIQALFASRLQAVSPEVADKDAKTRLQEWLQARAQPLPSYVLAEVSGEGHQQVFTVDCSVQGADQAFTGVGSSRRRAEQAAAASALAHLDT
ncbi:MAG: ribonuclease III [Pseudomonadota bacterium]